MVIINKKVEPVSAEFSAYYMSGIAAMATFIYHDYLCKHRIITGYQSEESTIVTSLCVNGKEATINRTLDGSTNSRFKASAFCIW
jgi:hypothetical protein